MASADRVEEVDGDIGGGGGAKEERMEDAFYQECCDVAIHFTLKKKLKMCSPYYWHLYCNMDVKFPSFQLF